MSSGILVDPTRALLAELRASTTIATALSLANPIASARIWGERVPKDATMASAPNERMYAPMIGLLSGGGYSFERAILNQPRYELRAYSPQPGDARTLLYVALNAINERTIRQDGVTLYASFAADMGGSSPYPNIDPPTDTPYFYCFFGVSAYSQNRT